MPNSLHFSVPARTVYWTALQFHLYCNVTVFSSMQYRIKEWKSKKSSTADHQCFDSVEASAGGEASCRVTVLMFLMMPWMCYRWYTSKLFDSLSLSIYPLCPTVFPLIMCVCVFLCGVCMCVCIFMCVCICFLFVYMFMSVRVFVYVYVHACGCLCDYVFVQYGEEVYNCSSTSLQPPSVSWIFLNVILFAFTVSFLSLFHVSTQLLKKYFFTFSVTWFFFICLLCPLVNLSFLMWKSC